MPREARGGEAAAGSPLPAAAGEGGGGPAATDPGRALKVGRIMRRPVTTITPETSVQTAAALMARLDLGALPVCAEGRPVGILTDRDLVVRWAARAATDGRASAYMTRRVVTCRAEHTVEQAAHLMADMQIRRLVVLDAAGQVAGILSLGDIANDASEELAGQTLGEIVEAR